MNTIAARTADTLLSRTQQQVLSLLFRDPQRSFFATELIQLAACGSGTVQRELKRLCDCGLVDTMMRGKQRHYRVNQETPLYRPLAQLLQELHSPAQALHDALQPVRTQLHLARVQTTTGDSASDQVWQLLVVTDSLKLADLLPLLTTVEQAFAVRIEPRLYHSETFAQQQARSAPQLLRWLTGSELIFGAR